MAAFPELSRGAVAQYPSTRYVHSGTVVLEYVGGGEQRFRRNYRPAMRWLIRLTDVPPADVLRIEEFFVEQGGRGGSFSFQDPWDGTVYPDCSFDTDEMQCLSLSEGRSSTTLIIRNNQV